MSRSAGFNPFVLDALEPRVLLSGAPVDAGPSGDDPGLLSGPTDPFAVEVASPMDAVSDESPGFDLSDDVQGRLEDSTEALPLPGLAPDSNGTEASAPGSAAEAARPSDPSNDSSTGSMENAGIGGFAPDSANVSEGDLESGGAEGSIPSDPSLVPGILVTTLRSGNGPPSEEASGNSAASETLSTDPSASVSEADLADNGSRHLQLSATPSSGTISANETWSGTVHVTGDLTIPAGITLTVEAGTVVKVAGGALIQVQGTLLARGTPGAPILMVSYRDDSVGEDVSGAGIDTPQGGDWESLIIQSISSGSVLENVEIRHAGMTAPGNRDFRDAILIQSSSVTLRDVRLRDIAWTGIRVFGDIAPTLSGVDVQGSGNVPYHFTLGARPALDRLSASNNATEGIWIDGGTVVGNQAWTYVGIPYFLTTNLDVQGGASLTLGPGTIVRMAAGAYLQVSGTLLVNGTADAPVILTSAKDDSAGGDAHHDGTEGNLAPAPGDWETLRFVAGSGSSVIEHLEVRFAGMTAPGNRDFRNAIQLESGATLRNVRIRDSASHAIRVLGAVAPVLTDVDAQRSGGVPFHFTLDAKPVLTRLSASNNTTEGIWIDGGQVFGEQTWTYVGMPYFITTDLNVRSDATLTLGPGTIFRMAAGAYFQTSGRLRVQGTAEAPVLLTSAKDDSAGGDAHHDGADGNLAPSPGDWENLRFVAGSDGSVIEHLEIRYAGMTAPGNRDLRNAIVLESSATLRNVRIRDSASHAVRVDGAVAPVLEDIDAQRSDGVPFYFTLDAKPVLTRLSASNNTTEGLWIDGGQVFGEQSWSYVGLPYFFTTNVTVRPESTVTLGPGTIFRMAAGAYLQVDGRLFVSGTANAPVILTAAKDDSAGGDAHHDGTVDDQAPRPGDWESLIFSTGSDASTVSHLEVRYAGMTAPQNNDLRNAININSSAQPTLRNVRIRHAASHGVRVDSSNPVLENIDVQFGAGVPFYFGLAADPTVSGLTSSNNKTEGLWIDGGTLTTARRWAVTSMPYMLTTNLRIADTASLNLGPGVVVKMAPGAWLAANSKLISEGTLDAPVVITAQKDDTAGGDTFHDGNTGTAAPTPGEWEALYFQAGSGESVLNHTDIRYAGQTAPNNNDARTAIDIESGLSVTLSNVRVRDSFSHAIRVQGASSPVLRQVHVEGALGFPLLLDLAATPVIDGFTGANNLNNAIHIASGTLTGERIWAYGELPLWISSNLRVDTDAKLTIAPGTVLKMADGAWFASNGNLQAVGTAERPILFTSIHDDTVKGDSNGNGSQSSPIKGSWEAIYLQAGSAESVLDHVTVRYPGQTAPNNNDARTAVIIESNLSPTLRNLVVEDAFQNGISVAAGSNPTLDGIQIRRVNGFPLALANSANPSVRNLTATANGRNAIYIDGGIFSEDRAWDYGPLPIWLGGNLRVEADARLTIAPGTIVKIANGAWIAINGNLQAVGTESQPIVFTGLNDDGVGGDTNGDGSASVARPGDWESLYFQTPTIGSVLDHVEIRYAGETSPGNNDRLATISHSAGDLTIRNSRITQGAGKGIELTSGAVLDLSRSLIADFQDTLLNVANGTATVTETVFALGPRAVDIAATQAARASVTGSAFIALANDAVTHRGTDFAKALFTGNWWGDPGGPNDPSTADGRSNDNPAGALVSDYVDYTAPLANRPSIPGSAPFVRGISPSVTSSQFGTFVVMFSSPIDAATFGADDVVVTGPGGSGGPYSVASVTAISSSVYRVQLAAPTPATGGTYSIRIGPNIASAAGLRLDQDLDGRDGEAAEDVFTGTVLVDNSGPRIIGQTPTGTIGQPVDTIVVEFNEPVVVGSFGPDDIRITAGTPPTGTVEGFRASTYLSRYTLQNLEGALATLAGNWTSLSVATVPVLDLGSGGSFTSNLPFPAGTANFVVVFDGRISIPTAGDWTFAVASDDGFRLRIGGGEVAFDGVRGIGAPDLVTVAFPAAGAYDVELLYFNAAGGGGIELSAAPGALTEFSSAFVRVGDTAGGGLSVTSPATPLPSLPVIAVNPLNPTATVVSPTQSAPFDGRGFLVRAVYGATPLVDLAAADALLASSPTTSVTQT
ncbi:MAG: right-handed parallel beta-helix repeat-containing protein, partial [Limisphaerales bacterium]